MNEFWRTKASNERGEHLLQLTTRIIDACEGHYTIWQHRRHLIDALNVNLLDELAFIRQYTVERPKNYQLWHHREAIMMRLLETSEESSIRSLIATEREDLYLVLMDEPKNYHAWQYRQRLTRQLPLIMVDGELELTRTMLVADPFNNSAWNHRFFVLGLMKTMSGTTSAPPHWNDELALVNQSLGLAENVHIENQSVLSYCHSLPLLYSEALRAEVRSAVHELLSKSFPWHHLLYQRLFLIRE